MGSIQLGFLYCGNTERERVTHTQLHHLPPCYKIPCRDGWVPYMGAVDYVSIYYLLLYRLYEDMSGCMACADIMVIRCTRTFIGVVLKILRMKHVKTCQYILCEGKM